MIVRINCNVPGSKPSLICIRPPTFDSPTAERFEIRAPDADASPAIRSGELGDVTRTLGLSRRS